MGPFVVNHHGRILREPSMIASSSPIAAVCPPAPRTLEETGLNIDLVTQLVLKTLHLAGTLTGIELANRLGVNFAVIEPSLDALKWQHHCEVAGGTMLGGPAYRYRITDAGRTRAALFLDQNHYVGTAPVPLRQYQEYMTAFAQAAPLQASPAQIRAGFSHLVLSERLLDQVGAAVNGGRSMFIYGPPGNGKTVLSQAIGNVLTGEIAIPAALEIEGNIVALHDPVNHQALPAQEVGSGLIAGLSDDRRWIRCRRPTITVGGELTLEALDLAYNPNAGFYQAPVQLLANGGVLVIDDFGRQRCSPRELLNRWVVPLESRVDFLTLQTGRKFDVPFQVLVVFATNLKPADLVDEAFLRRIHYKVFAESPSVSDFMRIFENCCAERGIPFDREVIAGLLQRYFRPRSIPLRGCQPRDLIDQSLSLARYRGQPRELTPELLDTACASYFVDDAETPATYA
jgi:predicted ATPase with chaperone activity